MSETAPFLNNSFTHLPGGGKRVNLQTAPDDASIQRAQLRYVMPLGQTYQRSCGDRKELLEECLAGHSERRLSESTQKFHQYIDDVLAQLHIDHCIPAQLNAVTEKLKRVPPNRRSSLERIQCNAGFGWLQEIAADVWRVLEKEGYTTKDIAA
jgi:hypothetical protein